MAEQPSPTLYALVEPFHFLWLVVWFVLVLVLDHHLWALGGGAALEAVYLGGFARSSAYRRRVRLKAALKADSRRQEERAMRASTLRKEVRKRYRRIEKLHAEVVKLLEAVERRSDVPLDLTQDTLDDILEAALEFCLALQTIQTTLDKSPIASLKDQLAKWDVEHAGEPEDGDHRQARDLLVQRIAHLEELEAKAESLRAQLDTMEQTLRLLKEQLPTLEVQPKLSVDIEGLLASVETTRQTAREVGALHASALARTGQ